MASLRQKCQSIGIDVATISLVHDFFGFSGSAPDSVSVLTQVNLIKGKHVHMNRILVGDFSAAERAEVDSAIQDARDYYGAVNLGIGRIERYNISAAQAGGRDAINSDDEAETLTNEWTVHNHALDIFFVKTYSGSVIGLSRVDGPCDKDAKGMDGSVVAIEGSAATTGQVLAHEAGHYLGLDHSGDSNNLMFGSVMNGGQLTASQGNTMKSHCFVNNGV